MSLYTEHDKCLNTYSASFSFVKLYLKLKPKAYSESARQFYNFSSKDNFTTIMM